MACLGSVKPCSHLSHSAGLYTTALGVSRYPPTLCPACILIRYRPDLEHPSSASCVGVVGREKMGAKNSDGIYDSIWTALLDGTMAAEKQSAEDHKLAVFPGGHPGIIIFGLLGSLPQGDKIILWRKQ